MLQNVRHLPPALPSPAMPPSKSSSNLSFEIQPETQALAAQSNSDQSAQIPVWPLSRAKTKTSDSKHDVGYGMVFVIYPAAAA